MQTIPTYLSHDYSLVTAPVVADIVTTPIALSAPPISRNIIANYDVSHNWHF